MTWENVSLLCTQKYQSGLELTKKRFRVSKGQIRCHFCALQKYLKLNFHQILDFCFICLSVPLCSCLSLCFHITLKFMWNNFFHFFHASFFLLTSTSSLSVLTLVCALVYHSICNSLNFFFFILFVCLSYLLKLNNLRRRTQPKWQMKTHSKKRSFWNSNLVFPQS